MTAGPAAALLSISGYRRPEEPEHARLRWAKLSLDANARLHGNSSSLWDQARMASHNFALRTWIIEHIGPDMDPDWDPEAVAADPLAVLTLEPSQASTAAADRQHLSIEQIGELRRHKNLTAHLAMLVGHLRPGPARDQVVRWIEVSKHMS